MSNRTKKRRQIQREKAKIKKINYNNINKVTTEFICEECYTTNMVFEPDEHPTEAGSEKKLYCNPCKKHTKQICVKDKSITKAIIELSSYRTPQEDKTYQMIKKSTNNRRV